MAAKIPARTFNGTEGGPQSGNGGPTGIKNDIDVLCKMVNPAATHTTGEPGGIQIGNLATGEATATPTAGKIVLYDSEGNTPGTIANAANSVNVTTNINGHAIADIFESDGVTVKEATDVTNLVGGAAGSIPYQSGTNITSMLAKGTAGQVLKQGTSTPEWGNISPYILLRDEKAAGVEGGTFTQDGWRTRVLNTEVTDTDNLATLSSNQITLQPGTYRCRISCPAFCVLGHKARLQNITDNTTILMGSNAYCVTNYGQTESVIAGQFTLATATVLEIQHYCAQAHADHGFGTAYNFGVVEIYTVAEFTKVG